jgi:dTDP-4-dehydrorhamnose reductase
LLRVFGDEAIGLAHQEIEVRDGDAVGRKLRELRPDWIINTAAYNRVDDSESNAELAFSVNAIGALHVARAAAAAGAGVVYVSSDYVFGAEPRSSGRPYTEEDRAAPVNVYGASKCAGEELVRLANPRHLIVRTAGLYGRAPSRKGWTFPQAILSKARSDASVLVVNDQIVSPTFSEDLAQVVRQLLDRNALGLFHVTNAGECTWHAFANELLALCGVTTQLISVTTEDSQRLARRPRYSALASTRLEGMGITPPRPWQEALRAYVKAM